MPKYNETDKKVFQNEYIYYKVQKGDSLLRISFLTGISQKLLKESNSLANDQLVQGMMIKIPKNKLKKAEL